jgi:hypothetical protein
MSRSFLGKPIVNSPNSCPSVKAFCWCPRQSLLLQFFLPIAPGNIDGECYIKKNGQAYDKYHSTMDDLL